MIPMGNYNYKKGISAMLCCFLIWGFQPLYWYLCEGMETFFLLACRIIFAAVCCVLLLKLQGKLPQLKAAFCDKQVLKREIPAAVLLFLDWAIYLWAVQNGRVLECSLGYYIQPLVVFTFGAVMLFNMLSRLVITYLPRSKCLLISWLQSPSAVILEPPKIKSDTVSTVSPSISHEVMGPDTMIRIEQ